MNQVIGDHEVYAQIKKLGGNIGGDELVVEYEKSGGGKKTVGGEVVNAYENYDNRTNTRKILIDLESHAGNWRLEAIKATRTTEVTLYKLTWEMDNFEKVKVDTKTRVSEHDGVNKVMNAKDW